MSDQTSTLYTHDNFEPTEPYIRRRMTPIAILVMFVIGGLTPWFYQQSRKVATAREANYMADAISEGIQQLVAREPLLWAYKPQSLKALIAPFERLGARVECITSHGRVAYRTENHLSTQEYTSNAVSIFSAHHLIIGSIIVSLNPIGQYSIYTPWIIAIVIAFSVAWLLLTIPLTNARKTDQINATLLAEVLELNISLERRVITRTKDLENMNERLLTIQEEERAKISRNLHDELGQTLTGLRLQLTALQYVVTSPPHSLQVKDLINIVDLGIDQTRTIAYEQRPPELEMLGLLDAITAISSRLYKQTGLVVELKPIQLPKLDDEVNVALFRVAQEGLTNILRHSSGQSARILFEVNHHQITLSVEDNGNLDHIHLSWGVGLSGLHGRIRKLNGTLTTEFSSLGGLKLMAIIPIKQGKIERALLEI
jgi:two-component system, NarL family, sensor histidine kinase UhpB